WKDALHVLRNQAKLVVGPIAEAFGLLPFEPYAAEPQQFVERARHGPNVLLEASIGDLAPTRPVGLGGRTDHVQGKLRSSRVDADAGGDDRQRVVGEAAQHDAVGAADGSQPYVASPRAGARDADSEPVRIVAQLHVAFTVGDIPVAADDVDRSVGGR